jgi:hypothetical protein
MDGFHLTSSAQAHVDAYIEYRRFAITLHLSSSRIVGNRDGGKLLSEKEYAAFREKAKDRASNRIYVSWRNLDGVDCKNVLLFCGYTNSGRLVLKRCAFALIDTKNTKPILGRIRIVEREDAAVVSIHTFLPVSQD